MFSPVLIVQGKKKDQARSNFRDRDPIPFKVFSQYAQIQSDKGFLSKTQFITNNEAWSTMYNEGNS